MDSLVATIKISGKEIGYGCPCFIIAEAGVNHNGSIETAYQLVDAAKKAGADAVKFQSFVAERLATPDAPKADYQREATGSAESQSDMLKRLELTPEHHQGLKDYCDKHDIIFISTPFDEISADFLNGLGVSIFKISSGAITNLPLLAHVARKGKPIIVSTGMSVLGEVEAAVDVMESENCCEIILLHCVSNYPAKVGDVNLRAMSTMSAAFNLPVGYSDHTLGTEIALASAALGATVIEKHLTLDREMAGPDHKASIEPDELAALVKGVRNIEAAMGDGRKKPVANEANTAAVARCSLVAAVEIPAGAELSDGMIAMRRPGTGLAPAMKQHLIGKAAKAKIPTGTLLRLEMLS